MMPQCQTIREVDLINILQLRPLGLPNQALWLEVNILTRILVKVVTLFQNHFLVGHSTLTKALQECLHLKLEPPGLSILMETDLIVAKQAGATHKEMAVPKELAWLS